MLGLVKINFKVSKDLMRFMFETEQTMFLFYFAALLLCYHKVMECLAWH